MTRSKEKPTAPHSVPVIILDFGSQFTQLIARAVRGLGVYCEIEPFSVNLNSSFNIFLIVPFILNKYFEGLNYLIVYNIYIMV